MMVIKSRMGSGTATPPPEDIGCGRLHTSMLDWQECQKCRNLPKYAAWVGQPRFVEPPPPPKPAEPDEA
jgi:hypothetical protein